MPATNVLDAIYTWLEPNETAWYEGHDLPTYEQVYVPTTGSRADPVEELIERLENSRQSVRAFVTGQKGAGKSMALRRVRDHRWSKGAYLPVVVRATETLPVGAADVRLLLLVIASAVAHELSNKELLSDQAIGGLPTALTTRLRDWLPLLGEKIPARPSHFQKLTAQIDAGFGKLGFDLRTNDEKRQQITVDPTYNAASLTILVNALLEALQRLLEESHHPRRVLLLVDDGDKYASSTETDALFIRGGSTLLSLNAAAVFTFPYWLHFDARFAAIASADERTVLPNVKVIAPDDRRRVLPEAQAFFRALAGKLLDPSLLDSGATVDEAARLSAGIPREFVRILKAGFLEARRLQATRLDLQTLQDGSRRLAIDYLTTSQSDRVRRGLKFVDLLHRLDDPFWPLLDSLHVVEYVNGKPWYAVNPLIAKEVAEWVAADRESHRRRKVEDALLDDTLAREYRTG